MPSSFYETLVDIHANDFEELKITGSIYALFPTVAANIAKFKRLRVLWLGDNEYNSSKDFINSVSTMTELQEINLNYSVRIRGDHLVPLLTFCTKLKRISLRYCCRITNEFVFMAIDILGQRTDFKGPILMLVGGSRVKKDIVKVCVQNFHNNVFLTQNAWNWLMVLKLKLSTELRVLKYIYRGGWNKTGKRGKTRGSP